MMFLHRHTHSREHAGQHLRSLAWLTVSVLACLSTLAAQQDMRRDEITAMFAVGDTMVASTQMRMFRSVDAGRSWICVTRTNTRTPAGAIWSDGTALYASSAEQTLRSLDGGATWMPAQQPSPRYTRATAWSDSLGLVRDYTDNWYMTTDHGANWRHLARPQVSYGTLLNDLVIDDTTWYAAFNGLGVYRTTDRGALWTACIDSLPPEMTPPYAMVMRLVDDGAFLYGAYLGFGLFRMEKASGKWSREAPLYPERPHPAHPYPGRDVTHLLRWRSELVAIDEAGLWRRRGGQWEKLGAGPGKDLITLQANGDELVALTSRGILRSQDGVLWSTVVRRLRDTRVRMIAGTEGVLIAVSDCGLRRSLDDGATWHTIEGFDARTVSSMIVTPQRVLLGALDGLYELAPHERTPRRIDTTLIRIPSDCVRHGVLSRSDRRIFAQLEHGTCSIGGRKYLIVSDDDGATWRQPREQEWEVAKFYELVDAGNDGIAASFSRACHSLPRRMNFQYVTRFLVARCSQGVFLSPNGFGLRLVLDSVCRLSEVKGDVPGKQITAMLGNGDALLAGFSDTAGVFRSVDGGMHWERHGLAEQDVFDMVRVGGSIYAAAHDGVWRSTDGGVVWTKLTGVGDGAVR